MRRLLALALLGLVCLAILGVVAYGGIIAPRPSARLAVLDGTVELQRLGTGSSGAARTGDAVQAGDAVRTAAGSHAAVSFGDGSLARLDGRARRNRFTEALIQVRASAKRPADRTAVTRSPCAG